MKILVIEDEKRVAQYIKKGLELRAHTVDLAYDGEDGLDFALSEPYEIIILDRMLPKTSGIEVCQQLRELNNHTPVLMLTAKTDVQDRVEGLSAGADDYLGKPFSFVELLARINALARRPVKIASTEKLEEDSLILDTISLQVTRAKKAIELSKREFALLEFLMRHPNQVLSKEQITQQVWSYESDVLPNTAQVYLGYLRKKIDQAFPEEAPLIHTVRGFGYKFGKEK